jgi:ElaB/YqjD/DUF883 family membrane-anchored ribosome-binding protein
MSRIYMAITSNPLDKQAQEPTGDLPDIGRAARDAVRNSVQEGLGQMSERAAPCCEQGRDQVHGLACACEQFVSKRPLRSVLLAAGVGWVLGRFWKRR